MMKMLRTFALPALCVLAVEAHALTPVETHGELAVKGNRIVDKDGVETQLAGPSLFWSVWGGDRFFNHDVVDWVVKDWKASVIRAPVAVEASGGYIMNPDSMTTLAKAVVDAAIANGIYVIVDWHAHDANLHVTEAQTFFTEMVNTYGDIPNIIWEIWNEPNDVNGTGATGQDTWADIKGYASEVIPVIRAKSDNIIVVGTPKWCQTVMDAANDPISGPNIAYSLHFYAKSHKQWLRDNADKALAKGIALMITEFGMTNADGGSWSNPGIDPVETTKWITWAAERKISWANWSLTDKDESSAALLPGADTTGNWAATDLSESGAWVRDRVLMTNDSTYVSTWVSGVLDRPAQGSLMVSHGVLNMPRAGQMNLRVFDASGQQVWSYNDHVSAGSHALSQWMPSPVEHAQYIQINVDGALVYSGAR